MGRLPWILWVGPMESQESFSERGSRFRVSKRRHVTMEVEGVKM